MEFQDLSYLPFPTQSGRVPLFPSVKALGLICFPGCGKRDCECGKREFSPFPSASPPFISPYLFFPLLFLPSPSISSSSSGFHSKNVRTTSGLLQTKLKHQQALEIKKTSLRIYQISKTRLLSISVQGESVNLVRRERVVLGLGKVLKHYTSL